MNPMGQPPFFPNSLPPPRWASPQPPFSQSPAPPVPPLPPPSSSFWTSGNVCGRLEELNHTIRLAKAMQKELKMLTMMKERKGSSEGKENGCSNMSVDMFSNFIDENRIDLKFQESLSLDAAHAIMSKLRFQLEPFRVAADENTQWEEKSVVKRLADKMQKYKRNKLWRKRKRSCVAEKIAKEHGPFDEMDKEADEWRAREIAKDIAKSKVENMKEISKVKAREEKKRLASELELVLIVEKLQELRSIRIQKLKKQGHFLPEEDDKFLEQVKAAVEEEERQAMAAANTDAAKDAIATAEESRKTIKSLVPDLEELFNGKSGEENGKDQKMVKTCSGLDAPKESGRHVSEGPSSSIGYDTVSNLPMEFYHYYHGSNTDMGTLIEVRRAWDAYIRPGGSRIPGHWVQPPSPADEIWASYLVKPQ